MTLATLKTLRLLAHWLILVGIALRMYARRR